jgi:hypothetical protein
MSIYDPHNCNGFPCATPGCPNYLGNSYYNIAESGQVEKFLCYRCGEVKSGEPELVKVKPGVQGYFCRSCMTNQQYAAPYTCKIGEDWYK